MLAQSDDAQRSQGEYSKYGHDKLTAHEESADKEISILTKCQNSEFRQTVRQVLSAIQTMALAAL